MKEPKNRCDICGRFTKREDLVYQKATEPLQTVNERAEWWECEICLKQFS